MENNNVITTQLVSTLKQTGRPLSWAAREVNASYGHFHEVLKGKRPLSENMQTKMKNLLQKMNGTLVS